VIETYNQGDIIYMDFDPQAGHEQKGRRPAIVVTNQVFNKISNLRMVCPITTTDRNHPLHVKLPENLKTTGFIMCDQARMLDLKARNAAYEENVPSDVINKVVDLIISFVEII
jgi:mRNA interferase MazF